MKKKIQLNLGCGISVIKDFINVDKFYTLKQLKAKKGIFKGSMIEKGGTYVQADMCKLPFKDNYADYIETVDAIEHISFRKQLIAFSEIYRVLKPGGKLCLITTDFDQLASLWTERISGKRFDEQVMEDYYNLMEIIYGNQRYAGEFHTTPFNSYFLGFLLQKVGFKEKDIKMTMFPMGTIGPSAKILKTSAPYIKGPYVVRTNMILVQAKK